MHARILNKAPSEFSDLNSLIIKLNGLLDSANKNKSRYADTLHKAPLKDLLLELENRVVGKSEAKDGKARLAKSLAQIDTEFTPFQGLLTLDANQLPGMANVVEAAIFHINTLLTDTKKHIDSKNKEKLEAIKQELIGVRNQLTAAMKKLLELEFKRDYQGKGLLYYFLKQIEQAVNEAGFPHNFKENDPLKFHANVGDDNKTGLAQIQKIITEKLDAIEEALSGFDKPVEQSASKPSVQQFLNSIISAGLNTITWKEYKPKKDNTAGLNATTQEFFIDYIRQYGSASEKYFIVSNYYDYQTVTNFAWGIANGAVDLAANILAAPTIAKNYFTSGWKISWPWSEESIPKPHLPLSKLEEGAEEQSKTKVKVEDLHDFLRQLEHFKKSFTPSFNFLSDFNLSILSGVINVYIHVNDYFNEEERNILSQGAEVEKKRLAQTGSISVPEANIAVQALGIKTRRTNYKNAIAQLDQEHGIFEKLRQNVANNSTAVAELNTIETTWKQNRAYAELSSDILSELTKTLDKINEFIQLINAEFLDNNTYIEKFYEYQKGITPADRVYMRELIASTKELIQQERVKIAQAMIARLSLHTAEFLNTKHENNEAIFDDIVLATIRQLAKYGLSKEKFIDPFEKKSPERRQLNGNLIEEFKAFILTYGTLAQKQQLETILGVIKIKEQTYLPVEDMGASFMLINNDAKPSSMKNTSESSEVVKEADIQLEDFVVVNDPSEEIIQSVIDKFQIIFSNEDLNTINEFANKRFETDENKLLFIEHVKQLMPGKDTEENLTDVMAKAFQETVMLLGLARAEVRFPSPEDKKSRENFCKLSAKLTKDMQPGSAFVEDIIDNNVNSVFSAIYQHSQFIYRRALACGYDEDFCQNFISDFVNGVVVDFCAGKKLDLAIATTKIDVAVELNCTQLIQVKKLDLSLVKNFRTNVLSQIKNIPDWMNNDNNDNITTQIRIGRHLVTLKNSLMKIIKDEINRVGKEMNKLTSIQKTIDKTSALDIYSSQVEAAQSIHELKNIVSDMSADKVVTQNRGYLGSFSFQESTILTKLNLISQKLAKLKTPVMANRANRFS